MILSPSVQGSGSGSASPYAGAKSPSSRLPSRCEKALISSSSCYFKPFPLRVSVGHPPGRGCGDFARPGTGRATTCPCPQEKASPAWHRGCGHTWKKRRGWSPPKNVCAAFTWVWEAPEVNLRLKCSGEAGRLQGAWIIFALNARGRPPPGTSVGALRLPLP